MTDDQLRDAVAVEVMGWEWSDDQSTEDHPCRLYFTRGRSDVIHIKATNWNPLTDWNHTMEVRDRLRSLGWWMELENECCIGCEGCILHHDPDEDEPTKEDISVRHEENPRRAICLAALQAVRSKA